MNLLIKNSKQLSKNAQRIQKHDARPQSEFQQRNRRYKKEPNRSLGPEECNAVVSSLSHVQLFCNPMNYSPTRSMEFLMLEYWSELPFLLQGIFPTQGSNPHLLHGQADSLPLS